ncbi:MAG TPA: helix-turn-helix domain-containing protein [Pseudonocardiaceae bacterium]
MAIGDPQASAPARVLAATGQLATPAADLLTVSEVATRWRVSKMTVYRMVHSEQLAAIRIGHSFRIPRAGVEAFLQPVTRST